MQVVVPTPVPLRGTLRVPGDKSLAHRALLLGAVRSGVTVVTGVGGGADVHATAGSLARLGVRLDPVHGGWAVWGAGFDGVRPGGSRLDCGNSGTSIRLLLGLLAGRPGFAVLDGDESLRSRPMERLAEPLRRMGAAVVTTEGRPPVRVSGGALRGTRHRLHVASAQVKGALLLAGLQADGVTVVEEPAPSRDHTERALARLGAPVEAAAGRVAVRGPVADLGRGELAVEVPGDPSSAAFLLGAALLVPGSRVRIEGVCLNPGRTGVLEAWRAMGADLNWVSHATTTLGEPFGWVEAASSRLGAGSVAGAGVVPAIDEIPLLAATAAAAGAGLVVRDARELRVKESDRIAATVTALRALGASATELPDGLVVEPGPGLRGGRVDARGDHRVAMAMFVAGLAARGLVTVTGWDGVASSYPEFLADLGRLGLPEVA